jgi:hypothetical protein
MTGCLLLVAAVFGAMTSTVLVQARAPVTPESLVKAAKRAAGLDYAGAFLRICVAPDNLEGGAGRGAGPPAARSVPERFGTPSLTKSSTTSTSSARRFILPGR